MVKKRPLVPDRIRRPPKSGWSWIDRRFLGEYAAGLSRDAILLYFFLAAVSDRSGLSFYSDPSTACRLRLSEEAVASARQELIAADLVAFCAPLTQVLSLPELRVERGNRGTEVLGDILRRFQDRREEKS